jgi:hypothetical protein
MTFVRLIGYIGYLAGASAVMGRFDMLSGCLPRDHSFEIIRHPVA